jgi:hypothetical protein
MLIQRLVLFYLNTTFFVYHSLHVAINSAGYDLGQFHPTAISSELPA